ncbi:MAG: hypothetical protein ACRYG8_23475 [Janthinobacterium lividum]
MQEAAPNAEKSSLDPARPYLPTSDIAIYVFDGRAIIKNLAGSFKQVSTPQGCGASSSYSSASSSAAPDIEIDLRKGQKLLDASNDPVTNHELQKDKNTIYSLIYMGVFHKIMTEFGFEISKWNEEINLTSNDECDVFLTSVNSEVPSYLGYQRIGTISRIRFTMMWDKVTAIGANSGKKHVSTLSAVRSNKIEGLGFIFVSPNPGICIGTHVDTGIVNQIILDHRSEFGGDSNLTGSFITADLETVFHDLKSGSCGMMYGDAASLHTIVAALDRDRLEVRVDGPWLKQSQVAEVKGKLELATKKIQAEQAKQEEARRACDADERCRVDRDGQSYPGVPSSFWGTWGSVCSDPIISLSEHTLKVIGVLSNDSQDQVTGANLKGNRLTVYLLNGSSITYVTDDHALQGVEVSFGGRALSQSNPPMHKC